ncbi:cysteine hydrolase family protein [Wielerella bovis]|uniref:cysteine hydrolase family protein n=1 Tax=Wielerella bovis TaxID=2917790 RepID=UPI002019E27E|nr:cysteine hydrolase family protein [Wielerella bovis]ULJ62774.1 cysteine hydrolase [Wielerella bovis]ULJ65003.1 cysteine hydrolase [Wielerella bovis]ULJ67276.1 cysteine hydrolase [Wielerella bovis]
MELKRNTALMLIDMQQGFDDVAYWGGGRNNPKAEENALQVLVKFRQENLLVIHVQHASTLAQSRLNPNHQGFAFKKGFEPKNNEILITKNVNSAFIGTNLHELLQEHQIDTLFICGLTTDHCVSTSTRMAGNLGYQVYVFADATATFDKVGINGEKFDAELIHQTALASLNGEFANVINSTEILK